MKKSGTFRTAAQREHVRQVLKLVAYAGGSISQGNYQRAYNETIEAQKHLIVLLGVGTEEEYFPKTQPQGEERA